MTGCIDNHGYFAAAGGWLFTGWASASSQRAFGGTRTVRLRFDHATLTETGLVIGTQRADLGGRGFGLMVFLPVSVPRDPGALRSVEIDGTDETVVLDATPGTERLAGEALLDAMRAQRPAPGIGDVERFETVLRRTGFNNQDTVDRLSRQIALRVDEAFPCDDDGLLLNGWLLAAPNAVRAIRLRSGSRSTRFDSRNGLPVNRPDVLAQHGEALRTRNVGCGFVMFVPGCLDGDEPPYLEIESSRGEVAYSPLLPVRAAGLAAIRGVLSHLTPRYDRVQPTFDQLGPALRSLNRDRLRHRPTSRELRFGEANPAPVCSVIVPLFGRIDFMEVQVALFADGPIGGRHELIYVVDDPASLQAACQLAESLFARFAVPLRLVLLDENLGFAPACNIGLAVAAGEYVCFLNSDVLPEEPEWLDRLLRSLAADPSAGLIGPLLLFEDGTVQHRGMDYETLPEFGNWLFPTHPGKGNWPDPESGLLHPATITGACVVMPTRLARDLGGFDEAYVIGDFEDSDLCLRARERGFACAVDPTIRLIHLERRSQITAAQNWRMNVTLFNAWQHQDRWADTLNAPAGGERTR